MNTSPPTRRRAVPALLLPLVAAVALLAASMTGAQAAKPTTKANTDTYSSTGYIAFPENGECIKYTLDGKVTYTAVKGPKDAGSSLRTYYLKNIKLRAPRLRAQTLKYDTAKHACGTKAAKFKKLGVRQVFAGYACSYNPSISVSVPWGVSASAWPSCGNKKAASYGSSYSSGSSATQLRSDTVITFESYVYSQRSSNPKSGPCYGGRAKFALQTGSIDSTKTSPRAKICLTPSFA